MTVSGGMTKQPVIESNGDILYAQIGDEVLDAAHAMLLGKNIDCTYLLENGGNIAENILRTVEEERCDGIVLGSRGLGVLQGLLRNSVSQIVLENAEVPVTIVK